MVVALGRIRCSAIAACQPPLRSPLVVGLQHLGNISGGFAIAAAVAIAVIGTSAKKATRIDLPARDPQGRSKWRRSSYQNRPQKTWRSLLPLRLKEPATGHREAVRITPGRQKRPGLFAEA
jgi:hypothetical protein